MVSSSNLDDGEMVCCLKQLRFLLSFCMYKVQHWLNSANLQDGVLSSGLSETHSLSVNALLLEVAFFLWALVFSF